MRVRAVHTTNPRLEGGTAWFFDRDPFLAYQLGRNLNFREFRERDGIFDLRVSNLGGPMPDGFTAKITANNQVSCSGCHNLPQGNPGGGANFSKDSGLGRNSPHYYGGGLMEMLALQTRAKMLSIVDRDGNGWVSSQEAQAFRGGSLRVKATANGMAVDFGDPRLSGGATGRPSLNNIFRVWYVDQNGRVVPGASQVDGQTTFGYNFSMVFWGAGQGPGRSALNPTNRAFLWDPWKAHGGLESHDPSTLHDPDGDGVSTPTLAGAVQFPVSHRAADTGNVLDPLGFSRDDPDQDGYLTEISEGDLDLAEWFMLNAPRPAFAGTDAEYRAGVAKMREMGCNVCHVPDWQIERREVQAVMPLTGAKIPSPNLPGDRRFFDLDVQWNAQAQRLEGQLVKLYRQIGPRYVRKFGDFRVKGLFTDFKQHDMGEGFQEIDFGGNVNRLWRTAPLWGVGSGFPWGHDGHSLTIEHAIQRHDGEGAASKRLWAQASAADRALVLDFLGKLVLYDIESLPTDMDGDGQISDHFMVAGRDTGVERFNPEWMFRIPAQIQGPFRNTDGITITSFAVMNIDSAYGQTLNLRRDSDADGWPDVWDHAPTQPGYRDGVR